MTLVVVSIVVMFVTALVGANRNLFGFAKRTNDRAAALALARGGINRLIDRLTYDDDFTGDLTYGTPQTGYFVTFDTGSPNRSVNNIFSDSLSPTTNFEGNSVPPHTADILVVARSNGVERKFRYIVKRGLAFQGAMACNKQIVFGKDVELKSITGLHNEEPVETRFHANDYDDDGTGVVWDGDGEFLVGTGCEVSSASSVDASIIAEVTPDEFSANVPSIPVPSLDIDQIVADNSGAPPPTVLPVGGFHCDDNRYLSTSTTVLGNVSLYDGSLYVQGDLTIKGGVIGYGSIYATGNVTIEGGNASVVTNQPSGAAVLAGGNITFQALSASGFVDQLAASDPTVAGAWNDFKKAYNVLRLIVDESRDGGYTRPAEFYTDLDPVSQSYGFPDGLTFGDVSSPKVRADDIHWTGYHLSRGTPLDVPNEVPISIPGPDPTNMPTWGPNSYSRRLWESVTNAAPADPRTAQVGSALNHVLYFFRHNWWGGPPNDPPVPFTGTGHWDDHTIDPGDGAAYSLDRQLWVVHGGGQDFIDVSPDPEVPSYTADQMAESVRDYFRYHDPLDFGWLGRAYFQGLLYAKGDVTIVNRTEVIGTVMSGGNLTVADGAKFTYNKEYDELTQSLSGPVRVVSFREI